MIHYRDTIGTMSTSSPLVQRIRAASYMQKWGDRVRLTRLALRMSQAELAAKAHTSQQRISQIESGTSAPSDVLKCSIADALHANPDQMFPLNEVSNDLRSQAAA